MRQTTIEFFKLEAQQGGKILSQLNRPATIDVKYSAKQSGDKVKVHPNSVQLYSYDENLKLGTQLASA